MNDPFLKKLLALAKVQRTASFDVQAWESLERELGLCIPRDVKELISQLGGGHFGEFRLLSPHAGCDFGRFSRERLLFFKDAVGQIAEEAGLPLFPDPGGFIQVGFAANRMDLLLQPIATSVSPYTIAWLEQDDYVAHFLKTTVAEFLQDLYFGLIPAQWAKAARDLVWGKNEPIYLPADQIFLEDSD